MFGSSVEFFQHHYIKIKNEKTILSDSLFKKTLIAVFSCIFLSEILNL